MHYQHLVFSPRHFTLYYMKYILSCAWHKMTFTANCDEQWCLLRAENIIIFRQIYKIRLLVLKSDGEQIIHIRCLRTNLKLFSLMIDHDLKSLKINIFTKWVIYTSQALLKLIIAYVALLDLRTMWSTNVCRDLQSWQDMNTSCAIFFYHQVVLTVSPIQLECRTLQTLK